MLACTVCVPGRGPVPCDLFIVGMNPGALEDARGEAFIGPSGEILNEALEFAGIKDAYITNAAKCFSGKRKPTRAELSTCSQLYLKPEIEAVKPRLIVALGDLALLTLTNKSGVGRNRGQMFKLRASLGPEIPVICSYHPAAFLHSHDPEIKEKLKADLKAARDFLEGNTYSEEIKSGDVTLYAAPTLSVDVETDEDERIIVGTISAGNSYLAFPGEATVSVLSKVAATKLVAWGARFEIKVLKRHGVDLSRFKIIDPMLMLHVLDSARQGRYGLKQAVIDEFGKADPEWLAAKDVVHAGGAIDMDALIRYCGTDSVYNFRLYERYRARLTEMPRLAALYTSLVLPTMHLLAEVDETPVPLDVDYLKGLDADFVVALTGLKHEMAEMVGEQEPPNFRSNKVLAKIMYDKLKLPIVAVTDSGAPSTDKAALMELRNLSPFAEKLINFRRMGKLHSSYVLRWLKILGVKK